MQNKYSIFICAIMLMFAFPALSADYNVKNIRVDVEADSAIKAREEAMASARRKAFNVLMGRVLTAQERSAMPEINDRAIASMVDSFEVNREKLSKNRYLASVNVMFNDNAVQTYINRQASLSQQQVVPHYSEPMGYMGRAQQYPQQAVKSRYGTSDLYRQYQDQKPFMNARQYKMEVHLYNIREWMNVQNKLKSVGRFDVVALRSNRAILNLAFDGDASTLQRTLDMKGLKILNNNAITTSDAPYILKIKG